MTQLIDVAMLTLFAREALEGSIIIAEYRTVVLYSDHLEEGVSKDKALRAITVASLGATVLAAVVIMAVAIPLAVLSKDFDPTTASIIEGVSKMVAGVCMLQLSLKLPKWLGLYGRANGAGSPRGSKQASQPEQPLPIGNGEAGDGDDCENGDLADGASQTEANSSEDSADCLTLRSIQFNVAWNIWREVAECGVFLIPSFLTGEGLIAIPLSALIGIIIGGGIGVGVYFANRRLQSSSSMKWLFSLFVILLVSFLSAGLMTDGAHHLEKQTQPTKTVWAIPMPSFWDAYRMPMTFLKPFGYTSSRTVLQIVLFWSWLILLALLQYVKYRRCTRSTTVAVPEKNDMFSRSNTVEFGDSGSDSRKDSSRDSSEERSLSR